jgi:RimJ/RimL family protein N-acetyltransferase
MVIGNKVVLRAVEKEDLTRFFKWSDDYEFKRYYNFTIDFGNYDEAVDNFYKGRSLQNTAEFSILDKSNKILIGRCMLTDIDLINKKSMCMMYIDDRNCRDSGYGTEAMRLLMKFAFEDLGLNRLGAWVFDFNKYAIRCFKNCGMKVEGIMREGIYRDGKYQDVYFMGVLKNEYVEVVSGGDSVCLEENM